VTAILRLESVDQRFGGLHALKAVSFEVEEGEILGVIGPSQYRCRRQTGRRPDRYSPAPPHLAP